MQGLCVLTAFSTAKCVRNVTLHQNFVRVILPDFLTALTIFSVPSLTLNPTFCSFISAMMWSACWSTATNSISFRESPEVQSVVVLFPSIRQGCALLLSAKTMLARSHRLASASIAKPIIHMWAQFTQQLSPSGTYCIAFRWEFLVLDLPGSEPFFVISSLARTLLLESDFIFQASLLHSSIFIHSRPFLLRQDICRQFCLNHLCCFVSWTSLRASQQICFATRKQPLFALNIALFTLRSGFVLCPPIGRSSCFFCHLQFSVSCVPF